MERAIHTLHFLDVYTGQEVVFGLPVEVVEKSDGSLPPYLQSRSRLSVRVVYSNGTGTLFETRREVIIR